MPKIELNEWQAESFRLSAFMVEPNDPGQLGLWQTIVDELPAVSQSHPREQKAQEAGPFLGGWLAVEVTPSRVDWRLRADRTDASAGLPTVGPYDTFIKEFREHMLKWLDGGAQLNRLAFGAVLFAPVPSTAEAYKALDSLLPSVKIDPENTRDLMYRINRRRPSRGSIEGLQINRLCTWGAGQLSSMLIELGEGANVQQVGKPQDICRLELDINTAPESGALDRDALPALFDELIDLGSEIASKGDIP